MTVPALSLSSSPASEIDGDVLVVGVRQAKDAPELLVPDEALAALLEPLGVTGAADEVVRAPGVGAARSVAFVGVGESVDADALRYAAGSATRQLRGLDTVVLELPVSGEHEAVAVLEGAAIGAYAFTAYRSAAPSAAKSPASRIVLAAQGVPDAALEQAAAVAEAVHTVRDLVNTPPLDLYPESLADFVQANSDGLEVEVLAHDELVAGGYGGILGVGQGSTRGPRLVKVVYSPEGAQKHLALVGKGITFDSGGLSLKPAASMVGMKYDMTGAATVFAVTRAVARLGLPIKVTAWLCIAENMPSGSAIRPNDVLRIRGGKTVEVLNTDAEGRLVLADGLVAASEEQPDAIIDVATLTGAASVALGNRYVGTMGDDELVGQVVQAAKSVGETLWPMPLPGELRALLASDVADIANAKPGNTAAGMLLAAVFLREFIGTREGSDTRIPWAHLDIAGPANNAAGGYGFTGKGSTGVAVRALVAVARELGRA
ncbi:leucyl aminopeptidase [Desertivibrio insolitus]|uniref:leucyl aminopeptidase n=1 Tax=Herbiconiux sp. SYSU D00978 TaxID=2812562 RepID=UPI001A960C96|nr:leucyl aminopeptidase [Herbiconiux sp. SYSU D00978]